MQKPNSTHHTQIAAAGLPDCLVRQAILDHCILISKASSSWTLLDLDKGVIHAGGSVTRPQITAIEKLAASFGLEQVLARVQASGLSAFKDAGYTLQEKQSPIVLLSRSIRRRKTQYARKISGLLKALNLPSDYGRRYRIPLQSEARILQSIGEDIYQREQFLTPGAAHSWEQMVHAALRDEVQVQAVSGYRSVAYQSGLVEKKINKGLQISEILSTSAAPGYSEHHTGTALDVTTPGSPVLEEEFEGTVAFSWLLKNAGHFGFRLSFPRDNHHGLAFEPWHWRWHSG